MNYEKLLVTHSNNKIYKDGGKIIKVFNKDYSKSEVFREAFATCRVEEAGLNVPTITGIDVVEDRCHMFMEPIKDGKLMSDIMDEDSDNVQKYISQMVDIQINMHSKKCSGIPALRNKIYDRVNVLDIESTKKYDLLFILEGTPRHRKLCHGNFNPTHVIMSNGAAYIADWNHATLGNASADVAQTYLWLYINKREIADMYLDNFCEKSNTDKKYVKQWLPIVAAAALSKDVDPEEEKILLEWTDKIEYEV